jgi:hypothetical protein
LAVEVAIEFVGAVDEMDEHCSFVLIQKNQKPVYRR